MAKKGELKCRVGEKWLSNGHGWVEIIKYFGTKNCTVIFEDGTIRDNVAYQDIKEGKVANYASRLRKVYVNNQNCKLSIIEYITSQNCTIQFEDGSIYKGISYHNIKKGKVYNYYFPSIYGKGYIGIGKYQEYENSKLCIASEKWRSMLTRCYSEKYQERQPTYIGCTVDERWHNFQVFAKWFYENYNPEIMDGWHLDKDILVKGNKIYSPETCCFVPREINNLFVKGRGKIVDYTIGTITIGKSFRNHLKKLGGNWKYKDFTTIIGVFERYKTTKESYIKEVAEKWKPLIDLKVYEAMYNYKVEITD